MGFLKAVKVFDPEQLGLTSKNPNDYFDAISQLNANNKDLLNQRKAYLNSEMIISESENLIIERDTKYLFIVIKACHFLFTNTNNIC